MRKLPSKPSLKQRLIIEAVRDYFGETNLEEKRFITKIALWLMGRKKGISLTEEEEEALERIRENLKDGLYVSSLSESGLQNAHICD